MLIEACLVKMEPIFIRTTLGELLREGSHKVAISLPELVQQTNSFSVKNRPGCSPVLIGSQPKDLYLNYRVTCHLKDSDPAGHEVRVHFDATKVKETQRANDLDVKVSCSCPAFLYWGAQWNLNQRDGLEGTPRPLLTAPTERLDLRGNFVICKHCKAVFERILPAVQNNINNLVRKQQVEQNKDKQQTPERLEKEQEKMRKRKELETLRKQKNKDVQKQLMEGLTKREIDRMEKEKEDLGEEDNPSMVTRTAPSTDELKAEEGVTPEPESTPEPEADKEPTTKDLLNMMEKEEEKNLLDEEDEE